MDVGFDFSLVSVDNEDILSHPLMVYFINLLFY